MPRLRVPRTAALLLAIGVGAACQATPASRAPRSAPAQSSASHAAAPTGAPSADECAALWARYHNEAPDDPYVSREPFVARCQRSEREVLTCPERARQEILELVRRSASDVDAGQDAPDDPRTSSFLIRFAMPSRNGICMARERARFALRSRELDDLATEIGAGRLVPDADGVLVAGGRYATLPSLGIVETDRGAKPTPPGELRVSRRPDGRTFIYILGALLGRHQNQVGFVYSSAAFRPGDFAKAEEDRKRLCLSEESEDGAGTRPRRYLLPCFDVTATLAANLLEVGAAPD